MIIEINTLKPLSLLIIIQTGIRQLFTVYQLLVQTHFPRSLRLGKRPRAERSEDRRLYSQASTFRKMSRDG